MLAQVLLPLLLHAAHGLGPGHASPLAPQNYAVLVAGSNGYGNYRHQADICHAFHILHDIGGIPAENIVVLMADDIAHNEENPFQGNIINVPNGPNVYPGVNKNVTGENVTAKAFLDVLENLPSTANDNVFVYFSDHGAKGLVAMPFGDPLYADQLMDTLKKMHQQNMFHQLVFYIEACESGSMFDGLLPADMNIYATTASDDDHSSFAWFFDDKRGVYLADQYSIMWMLDSQANMTKRETLLSQFQTVKAETNESSVQEFGDLSIQKELVENFQGYQFFVAEGMHKRALRKRSRAAARRFNSLHGADHPRRQVPNAQELVDSRDVVLRTLENRLASLRGRPNVDPRKIVQLEDAVASEKKYRSAVDDVFAKIVYRVAASSNQYPPLNSDLEWWFEQNLPVMDFDCLRATYTTYNNNCLKGFEDYSLKYVRVFSNLCFQDGKLMRDLVSTHTLGVCAEHAQEAEEEASARDSRRMEEGKRKSLWRKK